MRKVHKAFLATAIIVIGGALYACNSSSPKESKDSPVPTQAELVKRGEYLVNGMGCDDCHSPKRMGPLGPEVIPELRLSGYPADRPVQKTTTEPLKQGYALLNHDLTSAVGPWGVSFAANITSDETGIGNWTEQNFMTAIRKGKAKGIESNRSLLPPMPWFVYKNLTDEDIKSIFAYLKSTPPIRNIVPAPMQLSDFNK